MMFFSLAASHPMHALTAAAFRRTARSISAAAALIKVLSADSQGKISAISLDDTFASLSITKPANTHAIILVCDTKETAGAKHNASAKRRREKGLDHWNRLLVIVSKILSHARLFFSNARSFFQTQFHNMQIVQCHLHW